MSPVRAPGRCTRVLEPTVVPWDLNDGRWRKTEFGEQGAHPNDRRESGPRAKERGNASWIGGRGGAYISANRDGWSWDENGTSLTKLRQGVK